MSRQYGERVTIIEATHDAIAAAWWRIGVWFRSRKKRARARLPINLGVYEDVHQCWCKSHEFIDRLHDERAELTQVLMSLIARDDDGSWTTVFDADTILPAEYQDVLHKLVDNA